MRSKLSATIMQTLKQRFNKAAVSLIFILLALWITPLLSEIPRARAVEAPLSDATIEVVPASVELAPNGQADVLVVIRNTTAQPLLEITISPLINADVTAESSATPTTSEIAPGASAAWTFRVKPKENRITSGTLHFHANYTVQRDNDSQPIPQLLVAALEVKLRKLEPIEQGADIQIKTAVQSINEQRPGRVQLIITNPFNTPLSLKAIHPEAPAFIKFEPSEVITDTLLGPRATVAQSFIVSATDIIEPGKHLIIFKTSYEQVGQVQQSITTQEVSVGVLGESEILTALAVPSFLILPGFLMIVTAGLLWRLGLFKPQNITAPFPLQVTNNIAEFWLCAITLSGIMAYVYPQATGRYYLQGYGLGDIVRVWLISVFLIGAGGYLIGMGIVNAIQRNQEKDAQRRATEEAQQAAEEAQRRKERTFTTQDEPLDVLRRLAKRNQDIHLKTVLLRNETQNDEILAYTLEPDARNLDEFWVAAPVTLQWQPGAATELQQKVDEHLKPDGDIKPLIRLLEEGQRSHALTLYWVPTENKPRRVKKEQVKGWPTPQRWIRTE